MSSCLTAPGHRAENEARILAAVLKSRNHYSKGLLTRYMVLVCPVAGKWGRATLQAMNAESPSTSVLSGLWQQIRAVLDLVLDLSFKRFVTPRLVRMLYVLSMLAALIYALQLMFSGFWGFIMAPVGFLLYLIVARVLVELILAIFRIAEKIAPMSEAEAARMVRDPVANPPS